jgi:hypothetical protein
MAINKELLDSLGDNTLVQAIGALYDLGEDATPLLADHLEQMNDVQDRTTALLNATKDLYAAYKEQAEQLQAQKDANVKLMYDATQRGLKTDNAIQREQQAENDKFDAELANIELSNED